MRRRLGGAVGCAGAMLLVTAAADAQREPWDAAAASEQPWRAPAVEDDERLRGAALQHELPGAEFGTELPVVRVLPVLGVRPPFGGCLATVWGGKCGTAGMALGYAPFPQMLLGEFYLTYPIELGG